jgi:spore coat-associated protein N
MSRISTLRRHPKRTLVGLAAVLAAVAVAVGSGADFTSTSSNASNTFTAGILSHSNTATGNAFSATPVSLSDVRPGFGTDNTGSAPDTTGGASANYGQVKLTNSGSGTENIGPTAAKVVSNAGKDTTACGGTCSALAGALKVQIKRGSTVVFDDTVSKLDGSSFESAQSVAKGSSVTYDMYFYLPQSTGNAYQGGDAQVTFNWSAT